MAPSLHFTAFPLPVYWQVWPVVKPGYFWRVRLHIVDHGYGDTFTYDAPGLVASHVLAWDRLYTVQIDERTHPAIAEKLAGVLLRRGIVAWSVRLYSNSQAVAR